MGGSAERGSESGRRVDSLRAREKEVSRMALTHARKRTPRTTDRQKIRTYLRALPPAMRKVLSALRTTILSAVPDAEDGFAYGMPAVRLHGRPLVYYAAFTAHCSFFPASKAVIASHRSRLTRFELSKGTIRFTPAKPLSAVLIRSIVRARAAEHLRPSRRTRKG